MTVDEMEQIRQQSEGKLYGERHLNEEDMEDRPLKRRKVWTERKFAT